MEVSRELKKSAEEREKLSNIQTQNEKKRKEIYEKYLKDKEQVKDGYLKFQLFEEQEKKCPYCGQQIDADDIYNSRVDIDHIFPISESFDNSRNNLVLAHNSCNEAKGQRCPYDAFAGTDRYDKILSYLDTTHGMKAKKWRFMEGTYEEFLKNIPIKKRFETDTSYISKSAQRYLSSLFGQKTKVIPYKGGITAQLRLAWDLNRVLIPYIKENLYDKEKEDFESISSLDMKFRMDHRHHAIDAIALAYASRGYSNLINTLSSKGYKIDFNKRNWISNILKPPYNDFPNFVKEKIKEASVSIKHDHNPNGELLGETFYKVYLLNNKYCLVTKRQVININADNLNEIEKELTKGKREIENSNNQELKNMLQRNLRVLENIKNNLDKAKQILEEEKKKAKDEGKKVYEITDKKITKKVLDMVRGVYFSINPNKEKGKFFILKEPQANKAGCGYDTGDNLCLDLYYNKNGKLCGEVIRKIDAVNKNFKPAYFKNGFKLFERIYVGDILELDKSNEKVALKSKTGNSPENRVFVKVTTFTELPSYYNGKLDQIQIYFINISRAQNKPDDSFYISSMKDYKPRKVILTSLGAIKYRSKILGDLNVENN
jgi:CRISPR-associated endonuclease Csn1